MRILLTGAAGFIGAHAGKALLDRGHEVIGLDSLDAYYDVGLKRARLQLLTNSRFRFVKCDIADEAALRSAFPDSSFDVILHLAAQAGVRYALENPAAYTRSNLVGHQNVLELARRTSGLTQLIYASSSSVYGNDTKPPYSEEARADRPVSYYGATKRAGELLSHSYAELFGLKQTGLRFFTVYGPWGRPDMAYWLFTDAIMKGRPLKLFGRGLLKRDFTWIDDIVTTIARMVETPFVQAPGAPHRLYNLGNSRPEEVRTLVKEIEAATGKTANIQYAEEPAGDVKETYADISRAAKDFGFKPSTSLSDGIPRFVDWFRSYHRI
ncbi:MAG TPA: NAD-dependent epimerase/dehydratase family protein [Micropepsaceae bacterium]|nr:NAD-dependent epimerase/dehydratase family protein [Micropepsaceae bacterium]